MSRRCRQCGKEISGDEMLFCPYCGQALAAGQEGTEKSAAGRPAGIAAGPEGAVKFAAETPAISAKEQEWLEKAGKESALPKREKILLKAREDCPGSFAIEWELLFIGHAKKKGKKPGSIDFSIIKSALLDSYRHPELYTQERQAADRQELFGDPQLTRCMEMSPDPGQCMEDYLHRLCAEYIDVFLEGDRRLTGGIFGLHLEKNHEKLIGKTAAGILRNMQGDPWLTEEKRGMLSRHFRQAYSERFGGKTETMDEALMAGN